MPTPLDAAANALKVMAAEWEMRLAVVRRIHERSAMTGPFGQMPGQTAAALSRTGQEVASIVTLRPGAPDMASSLWVGPLVAEASQAIDGCTCRGPRRDRARRSEPLR